MEERETEKWETSVQHPGSESPSVCEIGKLYFCCQSSSYQIAYAVNNEGVSTGPTHGPYILQLCMGRHTFEGSDPPLISHTGLAVVITFRVVRWRCPEGRQLIAKNPRSHRDCRRARAVYCEIRWADRLSRPTAWYLILWPHPRPIVHSGLPWVRRLWFSCQLLE